MEPASRLHTSFGRRFQGALRRRPPRAKALGCSVRPFHGQRGDAAGARESFPGVRTGAGSRFYLGYAAFAISSATLKACAAIVNAGLQAAEEGKNELSTT